MVCQLSRTDNYLFIAFYTAESFSLSITANGIEKCSSVMDMDIYLQVSGTTTINCTIVLVDTIPKILAKFIWQNCYLLCFAPDYNCILIQPLQTCSLAGTLCCGHLSTIVIILIIIVFNNKKSSSVATTTTTSRT